MQDRIITTTTFTARSISDARVTLERELDTGIVIEPHPVSKGFHKWAAKFARAWGTMLEDGGDGTVFVEVTRGRRVLQHAGTTEHERYDRDNDLPDPGELL